MARHLTITRSLGAVNLGNLPAKQGDVAGAGRV
jgi:hypothetical protein